MAQKTNKLPQHPDQINSDLDKASRRAFAKQGLAPYDWADENAEAKVNPNNALLPKVKPAELFLEELHQEVAAKEAGRVATGNVISIDVNSVSEAQQIPVHVLSGGSEVA